MKDPMKFLLDDFVRSEYVINSDAFDRRTYYNLRQHSKYLQQKEIEGCKKLYTFSHLVCDLFCAFYKYNPQLRNHLEIKPLFFLNRKIMKEVMKNPEYERLRIKTHFDKLASLWATEQFIDYLLAYLNSFPNKKNNNLLSRFKILIEQWLKFDREGEDKGSILPRTKNQLGKMRKEMENIVEELEEEISSIVQKVMTKLSTEDIETIKTIAIFCRGWGLEEGELQKLNHLERIDLAKKIRDNNKLKKIAELMGRYRKLAISKQKSKEINLPHEVFNITLGNDLNRILPSEWNNLAHRFLRYDFYRRYSEEKLNIYEMKGQESLKKGSLIVCIDCSGSMAGEPEITAKAIGLGLLEIARHQKRNFVGILFSSAGESISFPFPKEENPTDINKVIEFASLFYNGGTNYETPLQEAISYISKDKFNDGDIIFITDGICDVSDSFLTVYRDIKKQKEFFTYSILIGEYTHSPDVLNKISDRVTLSSELNEGVAGILFESL